MIKNVIIKFKIDGVGSIKRLHSKGERGEGLNREVLEGKWIFNMLTLMFGTMSFARLSIIVQVFWLVNSKIKIIVGCFLPLYSDSLDFT